LTHGAIFCLETYNEKVDVYSYAMCLVELVDGKLPWQDVTTGAEVPHKVTAGQRPTKQLQGTAERHVDEQLAELICDCWMQRADQRPDFTTILQRLDEMVRHGEGGGGAHNLGHDTPDVSRPSSPSASLEPEIEGDDGTMARRPLLSGASSSRPSSRSPSPELPQRPPPEWDPGSEARSHGYGGRE